MRKPFTQTITVVEPNQALAVFARSAVLGKTKTRLIPSLGAQGALDAHCALVVQTLRQLESVQVQRKTLWVTQIDPRAGRWAERYRFELRQQCAGDLGQRMASTLQWLLDEGASQACLVGSDCPDIDADYVEQAFAALKECDVVLGPAEDGGYGLVAVNADFNECIFQPNAWSTPHVLQETLAQAKLADLSVTLLDEIWDVDTPQDWQRYLAN